MDGTENSVFRSNTDTKINSAEECITQSTSDTTAYSTIISTIMGNSMEAQSSYQSTSQKKTQSVTTHVKRAHYKAAFNPEAITSKSFTDEFKADAKFLATDLSKATLVPTAAPSPMPTQNESPCMEDYNGYFPGVYTNYSYCEGQGK